MLKNTTSAISKIANSKFIARSKVILAGNLIAQGVTFLTSFVVTYFYLPEDLGLLGTMSALISIVSGTLSFRSELAIIHNDKKKAPNVFFYSTVISMIATTLFSVACLFIKHPLAQRVSEHFFLFLFWSWSYFIYFNSKQLTFKFDDLKLASQGAILKSVFTFFAQLFAGLAHPSFFFLSTGRVLGDYIGSIVQWKNYIKEIKFRSSLKEWITFIKEHKDYAFYMTPHHFCISMSQNVVIFFVESYYGLGIVGFFTLGQRFIQAPMEIIGSTLFNITTQRFAELSHSTGELKRFYLKIVMLSFALASFIGIVIFLSVDFVIPIFGPKWLNASPMVKALIPYFMTVLFVTPTINILRFINYSRLQLTIEIAEIVFKVLLLSVIHPENPAHLVLIYGTLSFVLSLCKTGLAYYLLEHSNRRHHAP